MADLGQTQTERKLVKLEVISDQNDELSCRWWLIFTAGWPEVCDYY